MPALALPPVGRSGGGFWDMAQNHMALATNQYEGQRPKQETIMKPPGKTGGGAIGSAAGGAAAGSKPGSTAL